MRCAGHVLADSGSGETPMLPLPLAACAAEAAAAGRPDPAEGLGVALLETLALALDPAARPVISPRCGKSVAWPGSTSMDLCHGHAQRALLNRLVAPLDSSVFP